MEIDRLKELLTDLTELSRDLTIAKATIDKRKREKRISEAKVAISDYVHSLPEETYVLLQKTTGIDSNIMSVQYAENDLFRCISAIKQRLDEINLSVNES